MCGVEPDQLVDRSVPPEKASSAVTDLSIRCGRCGSDEVVRTPMAASGRLLGFRARVRCLVCGYHFRLPHAIVLKVRESEPGEAWESAADYYCRMMHARMTWVQALLTVTTLVAVMWVIFWCALRFDQPLVGVLCLPALMAAWWVGRWLRPVHRCIPGHCAECDYDLRGSAGDRCPECGKPSSVTPPAPRETAGAD